jgi:hypothetical protein
MAKNEGMTNSGAFYNGRTNTFDLEKCFKERASRIKSAESDIKHFFNNSDKYTDEDLKWHSNKLADEFYTILITAIEWEKKVLKT